MTQQYTHTLTVALVLSTMLLGLLLLSVSAVGAVGENTDTVVNESEADDRPEEMPETVGQFLVVFQDLNGSLATETYSEFEVIRSQAVQDAQVGTFDETTVVRLQNVLDLLWTFDDAVTARQDGSYEEALRLGEEAQSTAEGLRQIGDGEQYAGLAVLAVERFHEETAQTLLSEAEEATNTPDRIERLAQAAEAYEQARAAERSGQVLIQVEELRQEYQRDLHTIEDAEDEIGSFLADCARCDDTEALLTEQPLSVIGLYADAVDAVGAGETGVSLADQHGLDDRESALSADHEQATTYRRSLAVASTTLILAYSTVVGLFAALFTWRLMLWRRDLEDSQCGDVILMGEMLNA